MSISQEKLNKLKEIIPEAFSENKIDWEKLKAALGEEIEFRNERYVLNWAGKSDAFRMLQSPTTATLVPAKEESVDFDNTDNLFIEGENLEVLKVLQKAYFGKIKMIYIDPPYNTGNDNFIYPDKFSETRKEYLSRIGDKDETGYMTREGFFRKNSKDSGHYHSNWLSMMYPRLFLARNLLREDGVIFVSIDDNEVHNLRLLMNEVFGEENFMACIIWQKVYSPRMDTEGFSEYHDYIIVYGKTLKAIPNKQEFEQNKDQFKFFDKEKNQYYRRRSLRKEGKNSLRSDAPGSYFFLKSPDGVEIYPIKPDGTEGCWRWSRQRYENGINNGEIEWVKKNGEWEVYVKQYYEGQSYMPPITLWTHEEAGHNHEANDEMRELLGTRLFDSPKPTRLIKKILETGSEKSAIVLDFFAGSCTTAHAVLDLNKEDSGNRKFIMVQLPEKCDEKSEAYKAGYKTIAEIGKERIRRVIKKSKEKQDGKLDFGEGKQDLGFKVFKLQKSNFKIWQPKIETEEELVRQLELHTDPVDENAETENILYELLLKSGVPLTAKIEIKEGYYLVNENEIALMLVHVDEGIIKAIIDEKPNKVIMLDRLFKNNDQLKTNTVLQMEDAEIDFKVV